VLLLFCLGLAVLVEFVIVHPRPPECEVVNLTLTRFSASNFNLSYTNTSSKETPRHGEHEAGSSSGPIQLLTAVIVIVIRASNGIQRIGTFYDHVHVSGLDPTRAWEANFIPSYTSVRGFLFVSSI